MKFPAQKSQNNLIREEKKIIFHQRKSISFNRMIWSMEKFNYETTRGKKFLPCYAKNLFTHLLLISWNPPSSRRIFANITAFKNGTSIISSRFKSTSNLYFFFFIINAIPGALPSNVIKKLKLISFWKDHFRENLSYHFQQNCTRLHFQISLFKRFLPTLFLYRKKHFWPLSCMPRVLMHFSRTNF